MMYKYKGTDKTSKPQSGYVKASNKQEALARIKETTSVIVVTSLTKTIDSPLLNPIREAISDQASKVKGGMVARKMARENKQLEKRRQQTEKERRKLYTQQPKPESFKALKQWARKIKSSEMQVFKKKPPIKDEETILNKEAYYELLDMFKERDEEFSGFGNMDNQTVIKEKEKEELNVDWSLIEPDHEDDAAPRGLETRFKVKVKTADIIMMTRRLQIMLSAGVSLVSALMILRGDDDDAMGMMLDKIISDIQNGSSFSAAIGKFPDQFDNTYVSLVSIGESSGSLEGSLVDVIKVMEQKSSIQKQMKSAAIYPSIIGIVLGVVVVLGSIFFIPMFEEVIMDISGGDLPGITTFVFTLANYIPVIAGVLGGAYGLFMYLKRNNKVLERKYRAFTSRLALRMPVVRDVVSIYQMHSFASTVGLMLRNGVRLSESLVLAQQASNNVYIKSQIATASLMMMNGYTLSEALSEQPNFDNILVNIILIGEETGKMSFALDGIANFYSEELERRIEGLMSMVQPLSILLIGLIAVPVVIAIYLPILDMSSASGM